MRLRAALYRDLPAIQALLQAEGLPADDVAAHLASFLVGVHGGKAVAAGGLELLGSCGLLRSVVVAPGCRGRGWGRRVTVRLIAHARVLELSELYLLTASAPQFFTQLGFCRMEREAAPPAVRNTRQFAALCPASAALMRLQLDGGDPMKITVVTDGPLLIETQGEWRFGGEGKSHKNNDRIALCRCGQSASKPFCDGTHRKAGFQAGGGELELTPR